ncbi:hypothetical protein GCM10018980_11950 [Streptomyces capoamus]|uniref:Uncharacterized protein n=1 Tax=Streptomyces capoamus TaxID=68183 RepID=A0A919C0I3_9ACTN|nr:hypothetical protein GCM10010501_33940 [Streptomyces libani subsp. rufus]GHG38809.1 hypothetical protein GCM10018980_11950 [Streptomyces capoamus]
MRWWPTGNGTGAETGELRTVGLTGTPETDTDRTATRGAGPRAAPQGPAPAERVRTCRHVQAPVERLRMLRAAQAGPTDTQGPGPADGCGCPGAGTGRTHTRRPAPAGRLRAPRGRGPAGSF